VAAPAPHHTDETSALTPRRGPDLLTMAVGVGALGVAGIALLGGLPWLPDLDGRWVLAVLALVVGSLLVIGSLRPSRR
jgi:hypothetical protein